MSSISELLSRIRPTDGPGYTDFPAVDIQTHRSIATWSSRGAALVFFGGMYYATTTTQPGLVGAWALVVAALLYASAMSMRLEALEWEVEKIDDDE